MSFLGIRTTNQSQININFPEKIFFSSTYTLRFFTSATVDGDFSIAELKENNYKIASIEQTKNSTMLNDFKLNENEKLAVIFGNEVKGVEQSAIDLSDAVIEIPQYGTKHSLNISVSCGVIIWDLFLKMNK